MDADEGILGTIVDDKLYPKEEVDVVLKEMQQRAAAAPAQGSRGSGPPPPNEQEAHSDVPLLEGPRIIPPMPSRKPPICDMCECDMCIQQEEKLTEKQEEEKHRDELEWNWDFTEKQEEKLTEKQEEEKHRDELEWTWFGARIGAADLQNSCDWDLEENLTEASETVTEALSRPPPSPPRGLSAPWAAEWDPHHEDYYFWNEETGATTWEKPDWVK